MCGDGTLLSLNCVEANIPLSYCSIVLQDATIERNWVKGTGYIYLYYFITTRESTLTLQ